MQENVQYNDSSIRMIGGKPKLTKDIVKKDVKVFLKAIQENKNQNFSYIWGLYNNNAKYPHQSGMHAGHIVFPTYTANDHPILCNTMPDSLLLKQIVCDQELMNGYTEIYKYFLERIKNREFDYWKRNCPSFFIDAFKVLLAGHYMAHNIVCLEKLSEKEDDKTYTYIQKPYYEIKWENNTIKKYQQYSDFLDTLREIDQNEDFLKKIQSYIVGTNKPFGSNENANFAIAAKYFIDELLANNELRKNNGTPTYNFNMVFDALVCAEINGKIIPGKKKEDLFLEYLKYYQENYKIIL